MNIELTITAFLLLIKTPQSFEALLFSNLEFKIVILHSLLITPIFKAELFIKSTLLIVKFPLFEITDAISDLAFLIVNLLISALIPGFIVNI